VFGKGKREIDLSRKRKVILTVLLVVGLLVYVNMFANAAVFGSTTGQTQNLEDRPFPADTQVTPQVQSSFSWGTLLVTVFIFLICLVSFGFIVKRINSAAAPLSPWLKVLDRQQLGQGQYLYLVELAGRMQILAASTHGVVKIAELDDPDLAGEIIQDLAWKSEQAIPSFWSELFNRLRGRSFQAELQRNGGEEIR